MICETHRVLHLIVHFRKACKIASGIVAKTLRWNGFDIICVISVMGSFSGLDSASAGSTAGEPKSQHLVGVLQLGILEHCVALNRPHWDLGQYYPWWQSKVRVSQAQHRDVFQLTRAGRAWAGAPRCNAKAMPRPCPLTHPHSYSLTPSLMLTHSRTRLNGCTEEQESDEAQGKRGER